MAALTLDIPVEDINALAATFTFRRFVLALLALPFFAAGYSAVFLWKAARWCFAAYRVGWVQANGPSKSTQIARLKARNRELEIQASRFSG